MDVSKVLGLSILTACHAATTPSWVAANAVCWSRQIAGAGETGMAFGSRGELTIAATFEASIDVGDGSIASTGGRDPIVARYDRVGALVWRRTIGGIADEFVGALAVDRGGDVFVTGSIGRPPDTDALLPGCFIAKLRGETGEPIWSKTISGTGQQLCRALAVNDAGYLFIAGAFAGRVELGAGLASRGKNDIWLTAFASADGAARWTRQIGGVGNEIVRALAVDPHGDVVLGGQFSGEVAPVDGVIDLGTGPLSSAGDFDGLVAKYSMRGDPLWAHGFGDVGFDVVKSVVLDRDGSVVLSGAWMRPQDFTGKIPILTGVMDGLLARYDRNGALLWQHVFTGGGSQAHDVAIDDRSRIWVSGHFKGRVEVGGRTLESPEKSAAYVAAFAPQGATVLAHLSGAPHGRYGYAIASGADGAIAVAVNFSGATEFCGRDIANRTKAGTLIGVMTPAVP